MSKEGKFVEDTSSRFSYFIENKFTVYYSYFPLVSIFFLYYVSIFILSIVNFLTNGSNFSLLNNENNISIATTVKLEPTNLIRGKKKLIAR